MKKRKYLFGTVKVSDKGQIVIPKEARDVFNIKPGDTLLMVGDIKRGMAMVKVDEFTAIADKLLGGTDDEDEESDDKDEKEKE